MSDRSFTTSFLVDRTPEEVFEAINDVRGWWSGENHGEVVIEGDTDKMGASFIYRYKDIHRSEQEITEMFRGRRVVWHVKDSYLSFVGDESEWNGTDIVFDISEKEGKTELRFTHAGLVPTFECYGECASAWSGLIDDSLRTLILERRRTGSEPASRPSPEHRF
ncbi:MAG: SRPBCC domain-containing protein [Actinomycetota bacterium]